MERKGTNMKQIGFRRLGRFHRPGVREVLGFRFVASQPTALLNRIEYAAEFLQASCDKTADTGF